jgi:putative PEP-CTERM system TPR-repeat lipoprotein
MNMKRSVKNTAILIVLLLLSCSKHQLTDEQYIERAKNYQNQHQYRAAIIELKNALQVNPKNITARELLGQIYVEVGDGKGGEKELVKAGDLGADNVSVRIYLARALLLQGRYKDVINNYKHESNSEVLLAVADAYMSLGDSKSASDFIDKVKSSQPDSISVKLATAKLALMQNNNDRVKVIIREILSEDPDSEIAWRYKGMLAMKETRFSDAEIAFQKVVKLEKGDLVSSLAIQAWLGLIQSQLAQKELKKAEQNISQLKNKSPSHPGVEYLSAILDFEKGDFETARAQLQKFNSKSPDFLPAVLLLGATHYALKSYEQAAVYLSRYVNEVPSHLHARKLLAATRIKQQRSHEALEILQTAEKSSPEDSQLLSMIALASVSGGDITKGAAYLKKAIDVNPNDPSIRAELARVFLSQGAFDQAIRELESIADEHGKSRDVLLVLAYLKKKDYDEARKLAKQLASQRPGPEMETLVGGVELISGARIAARNRFEKALKLQNDYVPALLNLGKMDLEDGDFSEASRNFDAVLLKQPANVQAIFGLAQIADRQGSKQQALAYIEKARETNPDAALPRLVLARYYLKTGEIKKATTIVDEFQESHLNEPVVILLAGRVYRSSGRIEQSIELFEKFVKVLPEEAGAHFELANSQARLGRLDDAKISLKKALALKKDFQQARYALAQLEMRSGDETNALALAKQIQNQDPQSALGYSLAGDIYMQQEDYKKAGHQYQLANKRQPSSLLTLKLASTYSKEKLHDKAIAVLSDRLKRTPEDQSTKMVLAQEYLNAGQAAKATEIMEQLLSEQPENAVILNNAAWMYHQQNDSKAVEYAERAHKLRPEAGSITDTLGWILVQNDSQMQRAVGLLKDAVKQSPNVPEIKYHLAVALVKIGEKPQAKELLNEIISANNNFDDLDKATDLLKSLN